jgi:hypothetical protein
LRTMTFLWVEGMAGSTAAPATPRDSGAVAAIVAPNGGQKQCPEAQSSQINNDVLS